MSLPSRQNAYVRIIWGGGGGEGLELESVDLGS